MQRLLAVPVDLVEHRVHDQAGKTHVKPDGKGPSGESPVLGEPFSLCQVEQPEHQRYDHDRKNHVRDEDGEVDESGPTVAREFVGPGKKHTGDVEDQEDPRGRHRADHTATVRVSVLPLDEHEARYQEAPASEVQSRVDRRENVTRCLQS